MNLAKEQNDLICSLKELGCKGMAEALSNQFANEYSFCELTFSQRLRDLIDREACSQKKQKYNRLIKQGKLKYLLTFNDIHFGEQDGISKDDLNYLISNHWALVNPVNIYIHGKTGVGKTQMCCALLNTLALEGYTIRFCRMCDFQSDVDRLSDNPAKLESYIKRMSKFDVLAIDDLGLTAEVLPSHVTSALFNIIDARVPHKPLVITTQMKPDGLLRVFGSGAQAEAILDRILRPCKIITLEGDSKRPTIK